MHICKRCGGSCNLLRPSKGKVLRFQKCTTCGGKGVKGSQLPGFPKSIGPGSRKEVRHG